MYCKNCGKEVNEGAAACLSCGADPRKGNKFCQNCGEQVNENQVICLKCGSSVKVTNENVISSNQNGTPSINIVNTNANTNTNTNVSGHIGNPKNKWVAFVLCLLLGYLGAHKFYEGKIGMGILYLFTGGLFLIGVVIDLISILTRPNPYYVSY